tara:strand:+ start:203 stop:427 length:225 start_codon:yes stop_codon:yes gene_type:complete
MGKISAGKFTIDINKNNIEIVKRNSGIWEVFIDKFKFLKIGNQSGEKNLVPVNIIPTQSKPSPSENKTFGEIVP